MTTLRPWTPVGAQYWGESSLSSTGSNLFSVLPAKSKPHPLADEVYTPETKPKPVCRPIFSRLPTHDSPTATSPCLENHWSGLWKAEFQEIMERTLVLGRFRYKFLLPDFVTLEKLLNLLEICVTINIIA